MSIVVLTSGGAAPGVTTSAVGLALAWPRPVVVVDADRQPSQAILAGYLGGADPLGRGLSAYAVDARDGSHLPDVRAHCLRIDGSGDKLVLPGFSNIGAARLFEPVWPTLLHALQADGIDAIVDAGRIGAGLPVALCAAADRVVLVTGSSLRSVAAQRLYVSSLTDQVGNGHARTELLVVGPGRPYPAPELADVLGLEVAGEVAWDPARAGVLSDGAPGDRRFARSPLATSFARIAERWVREFDATRRLLDARAAS